MSPVQELLEQTERLYEHVKKGLPDDSTDVYLEELSEQLDHRQRLIEQLSGQYSPSEREMGKKLVEINELIQPYLDEQMGRIKAQLHNIQRKRTNNTKYSNPYQAARADGMFLDKRK